MDLPERKGAPMPDPIERYMDGLFGQKKKRQYILLWKANPYKLSYWFTSLSKAIRYIKQNPKDIYIGIGTSPKNFGSKKRCKEKDIAAIKAFYADIDIAHDIAHKEKQLPPTHEAAMSLLYGFGFDPTWTINSGHGLHAYWIFKEPWEFENPNDYITAKMLNKRLNLTIKERAKDKGWTIDSVHDMARVLRPVGSINAKAVEMPVEFIKTDGPEYGDPETDFDNFLPVLDLLGETEEPTEEEKKIIGKNITLDSNAEVNPTLLDMTLEMDPKFKATWQQQREDMKDKSTSSYHMSLATQAVQIHWPDQEIANLLIAWNRRHGHDIEKPMRLDYVEVTLAKAKKNVGELIVEKFEDQVEPLIGSEYHEKISQQNIQTARQYISQRMNCQIFELVKYCDARTPKFTLRTSVGDVQFENADELLSLAKFRAKFFGQTNHSVEIPRNKWGGVRKTWNLIIREVEASRENTIEGRMEIYLTEFLEDRPHRDMHQAVSGQQPFVYNGHWYVYLDTFKRWALMKKGVNQNFKVDLKTVGCHEKRIQPVNPYNEKKRTSRYCWKIPKKIIRPSPDDKGSAEVDDNVIPLRKEG
jgi:hypothetical protein